MKEMGMYVDGAFIDSSNETVLEVINPATREVIGKAPDGTAADIDTAIAAARRAFEQFKSTTPYERMNLLLEFANRVEQAADELANLETLENGKPLTQSYGDVSAGVQAARYYAGAADKLYGDSVTATAEWNATKVYEPRGVIGVIIPWNWPPMHVVEFISPAVAAGNAVVMKPAPETPLSALRIAEIVDDIFPSGLVNVVTGGVAPGVALTNHPDINKLIFTGNDETGEDVLEAAAKNITPVMAELGGKNPSIIFEDAAIDRAVNGSIGAAFYNCGQSCINTERILVQDTIYDEFLESFCQSVEGLVVDDGFNEASQVGPLINRSQYEKVTDAISTGREEGATIAAESDTPSDPQLRDGFWVPPTVLSDVTPEMSVVRNEIFGPVTVVLPFETEAEAIAQANDTEYGLSAVIWTENLSRAHRVASEIDAGIIAVNNSNGAQFGLPFGGFGRSGYGKKKDFDEALREYTRAKSIRIDLTESDLSL